MNPSLNLLERSEIVVLQPSSDWNTSFTSDYVSLKNYQKALILVELAAGTAGDDVSLQMYQATDVSAGSEKALTFDHIYYKVGTQTSATVWTRVNLTSATADLDTVSVNSVDLTSDNVEATFAIEIDAADLDVSGGFDCICFKNDGNDLGNARYGSVIAFLYNARFPGALPLTAITD